MRVFLNFWQYRNLIRLLTWREVVGRYKGSFLGIGWSLIHPLAMLIVYTFVFSTVFKTRWGIQPEEGKITFALTLFMGLITFRIFADVASASPSLITRNINYVKKVVFPMEILPFVVFLNAMVNSLFSLMALLLVLFLSTQSIHLTILLLPVVWAPVIFFSMGMGYLLASLGVFIRDLGASVDILVNMLLFMCPIFYPIQAVPERFRIFIQLNPVSLCIEDARRVVLWGMAPDWPFLFGNFLFSCLFFSLGVLFFMKTKELFAEIL